MRNAIIVFKKEFYRVISDKRLLVMSVMFPGLMIFVMYSLMGGAISGETQDIEDHTMIIYEVNMPDSIKGFINPAGADEVSAEFFDGSTLTSDERETMLTEGTIDLFVSFPENFEANLTDYENPDYEIPSIPVFYNSTEKYSRNTYWTLQSVLSSYASFVNADRFGDDVIIYTQPAPVDFANPDESQGQEFAMLLPMLIVMFLFSGAMSIGPDSIAGEKERGTIATLLVTPVKRFEIAIGKVMSLSVISLMSATSSFVGIIFGLRNMMNAATEGEGSLDASIYGANDYLMIIAVLFATTLVIVGIISVISTYARTIKEASMLILPFYFISIIIGVSSMFSGEAATNSLMYLVPIYSSVNMLISILTFSVEPMQFMLMLVSSVVYVSILIFVMNRLFQSEKVMFSK